MPGNSDTGGSVHDGAQRDGAQRDGAPVFVLTMARSGSTLLRFILDAHPELCCPPELNLAASCAQLAHVWSVIEGAPSTAPPTALAQGQLSERAAAAIRSALEEPLAAYMTARGATRWCDKSLDGLLWAEVVAAIWPHAQFICLYRHCMDVIASGLEASRWGLDSFGFELYAPRHPGNHVAAVGACWADMTGKMLDFQRRYPDRTLRVRYEDLVADPEDVAGRVFGFLGVAEAPGISRSCFAVAHDANGPGDAKIWFTRSVSPDSVGRGREVPGDRLPPPLLTEVNRALRELGYVEVGADWNSEDAATELRLQRLASPEATTPVAAGTDTPERALSVLDERAAAVGPSLLADIGRCWPALAGRALVVEVSGPPGAAGEVRWDVPGDEDSGHGQGPEAVLSAPAEVWGPVLDGAANLFAEVFRRRISARGIANAHLRRTAEVHALGVLLSVAQLPAAARH